MAATINQLMIGKALVTRHAIATVEHAMEAIARLRTMSDRQLEDMGIVRSQTELEVEGEIARNRVLPRTL